MKHVVACTHGSCSLHVYSVCINSDKFIFSLPQFKALSCFELTNNYNTAGLLISNPNFECKMARKKWKGPTDKPRGRKTAQKSNLRPVNSPVYSVSTSHPIYLLLYEEHGLDKKGKGDFDD